jgi:hypothetical protein
MMHEGRLRALTHRFWLAVLASALPSIAWALPKTNVVGDWHADQAVAAQRFLLAPHTWSWIFAVTAVVVAAAVVVWGWRRPASAPLPNPPDWEPRVHRRWLWGVILALVLFYTPGFAGSFSIFDDPQNIWLNEYVNTWSWENLRYVLFENYRGVNQELMFLSLLLNHSAVGRVYAGFFAANLAMFPLLLLLVHAFARKVTRSNKIAVLAVAMFGVSPIVVELLLWMLERGHYFGLMFGLSSCVAYLNYLERLDLPGWRKYRWLALSLAAFFLCQMGKPIFLYVPVWLVLFDIWHRRTDWLRLLLDKVPYGLLGLYFLNRIVEGGRTHGRVGREYLGGSVSNTLAMDTNQVLEYLRSTVMPHETGLRAPFNVAESWWRVTGVADILVLGFAPIASLIILLSVGVVAVVFATRWKWPILLLALVASLVTYAPVANLPAHTVAMAYRYTLSTTVMAAIVLAAATWHLRAPGSPFGRWRTWLSIAFAGAWIGVAAHNANANRVAWREPVELWTRSADVLYPNDGYAHYYSGKTLNREGRYLEAIPHLEISARLLPHNQMTYRRLADAYYAVGYHRKAEEYYRQYFARNRGEVNDFYEKRLVALGMEDLLPRHRRR